MNKRYELSPRSNAVDFATGSILAIIAAMTISTAAHAEYRCSTPGSLTQWEKRACELGRQDTTDALIHHIKRMNTINAGSAGARKALEARATSGSTVLTIEPTFHRSIP